MVTVSNSQRLLRPKAACQKLGVGPTTLKMLVRNDPTFPRKVAIGRAVAFLEHELDAWIAARVKERDARLAA